MPARNRASIERHGAGLTAPGRAARASTLTITLDDGRVLADDEVRARLEGTTEP